MEVIDGTDFVTSDHDRLVNIISKLDKTQHIVEPTRNETTKLNSEFDLIKTSNKLSLNNVVKILEETAHSVQIHKKLKKSHDKSKVLPQPFVKPQAERVKRATGYENVKEKIGRWDSVVARARTVDYVSFPLKHVDMRIKPTSEFLSKLKLKSPLEQQLDEIDPPPLEEMESEEQPMSYEEMVERKHQMAKLRAQETYKAAKYKRINKIKSKKFHRILKKEKLKLQLKEFEELQKTNPEEALVKLEALEKSRALERHTLRHKNTGKWAKSKLVRAKYDKDVRQQLAEQLAVSRGLTEKNQEVETSDDDADNNNITDLTLAQDPMNSWMLQRSDKSNVSSEFDFGYMKYVKDKMFKRKDNSDSDSDDEKGNEEDNIIENPTTDFSDIRNGINKLCSEKQNNYIHPCVSESSFASVVTVKPKQENSRTNMIQHSKPVSTTNWIVETINQNENSLKDISSAFESYEFNVSKTVNKKLKILKNTIVDLENKPHKKLPNKKRHKEDKDNLEYLNIKMKKIRPIIDEELIETSTRDSSKIDIAQEQPPQQNHSIRSTAEQSKPTEIDPVIFIAAKPKYLNTALPNDLNDMDHLDDDDHVVPKVNMEIFEDDDIVSTFKQDKEEEIDKDKYPEIDLTLPGWGSWGGKGIKAPKRKKNRFITKLPPKQVRRDENKGDIIIKEYRDPKLASHKVTELPFPFKSVKEYEASLRMPIGNTFVPEKAHQKLIKPSVITKAGSIIEPMDEEELLIPKNLNFRNNRVMDLLSKK